MWAPSWSSGDRLIAATEDLNSSSSPPIQIPVFPSPSHLSTKQPNPCMHYSPSIHFSICTTPETTPQQPSWPRKPPPPKPLLWRHPLRTPIQSGIHFPYNPTSTKTASLETSTTPEPASQETATEMCLWDFLLASLCRVAAVNRVK